MKIQPGRLIFLTALWLAPIFSSEAQDHRNLEGKDVFTKGFPQHFAFRGEMPRASHKSYETWCDSVAGSCGVIRKFVREELPNIYSESPAWANRYALENPAALMLLHLNGESRQVLDFPEVHQRYFPGHWVYYPGTMLETKIGPADKQLKVEDVTLFTIKGYVNREKNGGKSWFPQHLILVPLDAKGRRLWYESEYAILESVDAKKGTITVERGTHFSKPRSYAAGKTYVAPLAGGVWGGKPMWFYNLSSVCPRDRDGQNAGDVFADEIAGWFKKGEPLENFNGIGFDVNYFEVDNPEWDVDNDGVGDAGIVDGRNVWMEGDWHFLRSLRRKLGDELLITADGQHGKNQRAVGVLDGIESEGLVQHNDGFRGFSRMVNTHQYWQQYNTRKHDLRYVVLKLKNPDDEKRGDQLRRLATGAASCLEAMITDAGNDFLPSEFSAPGSLGFPDGKLIRYARTTPDLLAGKGVPVSRLRSRLVAKGCTLKQQGKGLVITAKSESDADSMTVTLKDMDVPPGDLTVYVLMTAVDPLEGFAVEDRVPRLVRGHFSKTPEYGEGRYDSYYTDLYGYIGTQGPSIISLYLRRPDAGAERMDVSFEIQGKGRVALHGITAHSAPDVLVRSFDHGVVVVNPSFDPVTVPLGELLPKGSPLQSVEVPALDAKFLKNQR